MAWSNAEVFYVHAIERDFACDFTPSMKDVIRRNATLTT
jgi:hypothetical protein